MTLTNSKELNTSANLDTDLKENELSEDDLDAVSGGYPGNNGYEIAQEQAKIKADGGYINTDESIVVHDSSTGRGTRIYPNGRRVDLGFNG